MTFETAPMQQPIRRIVGRPRDNRNLLTRLYHLQLFARKIIQDRELIREGDYFSVRKAVGRPHRLGR